MRQALANYECNARLQASALKHAEAQAVWASNELKRFRAGATDLSASLEMLKAASGMATDRISVAEAIGRDENRFRYLTNQGN